MRVALCAIAKKLLEIYRKIYIKEGLLPLVDGFDKYRVNFLNGKNPLDEIGIAEFYIENGIDKRKSIE